MIFIIRWFMSSQRTRVNIYLNDKMHTDAKIASVLKKVTLASFLEKSIAQRVEEDKLLLRELAQ
jgi:hypothetical protein